MKITHVKLALLPVLAVMALAQGKSFAASDIIFGPHDSQASVANADGTWINMWGPAYRSTTFDTANPPPSGDTLGAPYNQGDWTGDTGGMDNYNMISPGTWWGAVSFDGSQYTSIQMDFRFDTNSTMTPTSAAHLNIGFDKGYSFVQITNISLDKTSSSLADGQWHHLTIPINPATANISACGGVAYYCWNPGGTSGTMNYWIANVKLIAREVPIAPPALLAPVKAKPGLNVFASTLGNSFFDRQEVEMVQTTGLSWVGHATAGNPVTYSFTISDYPKSVNCEAFLFLVPNPTSNDEAPDWNQTNCVIAYVQGSPNQATLRFRYKVNEDHQQAMYSGGNEIRGYYTNAPGSWDGVTPNYLESGDLGFVTNNTVLGTWTVKFTSDTNITLIAPNGNTSTCVMPAYNATKFAETSGFNVYLGMQANNADAMNQAVVYSNFAITGVPSAMSDNFLADTNLNTAVWSTAMAHGPAGVLVMHGNPSLVQWNLPDNGFNLQLAGNLSGSWTSPGSTDPYPVVRIARPSGRRV